MTSGTPLTSAPALGFDPDEITRWLAQADACGGQVVEHLYTLLYDELRRLARSHLRREAPGHTLSPTALSHEAWLRMAEQTRTHWRSRSHFLAVASTMMRRVLVNHALAGRAGKREAEWVTLTLGHLEQHAHMPEPDVVAVHEALLAFEAVDPRAARVVELRYFGGLENEEIAEVLEVSLATVKRDWAFARAWLHREIAS